MFGELFPQLRIDVMATILHLRNPHFGHVESNTKRVDARIFFSKYKRLKKGCLLKFVLGHKFILKRMLSMKIYNGFRNLLKGEGVKSCLPDLQDGDVDAGVEVYHKLKANGESYEVLARTFKVVALRLGEVTATPYRPLSRTEGCALGKLLKPPSRTRWLTRVASGSFADVYKLKRITDVMQAMQMLDKRGLEVTHYRIQPCAF